MNANTAHSFTAQDTELAETEGQQYLAFKLNDEMYSLPLAHVREIIQYREVVAVPMMPACVRGIINLRGSVIPIIDLAARFNGASREPGVRSVILVLDAHSGGKQQSYGVMVDAVSEVLALTEAELEPPPEFGAGIRAEFIAGIAKRNGSVMLMLETSTILAIDAL